MILMMDHDEFRWLVKSSGRILGPFPTGRVAELLRTREISVLDEISVPLRRWQTIQYHDEFREVVDSLRKANLSERTEATWTPSNTALTQTLTDVSDGDLTEEISADLGNFTATAKEIVIHDLDEQTGLPPSHGTARYAPSHVQNTAIQRQVEKNTRGLWLLTILVLVLVGGFIIHRRFSNPFEARLTKSGVKQNVLNLMNVGKYREALRELRGYYPDPVQAGELTLFYGALLINLEQQTVPGRRALKWVIDNRSQEAKQAYTAMAVADLFDGQLDSAQQNLDNALRIDADFVPAILNMSALYMHRNDPARAKALALRASKVNPLAAEAMLAWAEAQLAMSRSGRVPGDLVPIGHALKEFQERHWSYDAEIRFYGLYFDFLRHEKSMNDNIQAFLDRDPRLASDHRQSFLVYSARYGWKSLARYCEQMIEGLGGQGGRLATLLAACHAHEGRWDLARRDIERAVNQEPKDPLIQAWYSYVLYEGGDPAQASVVLARANELNRSGTYSLPMLLQARFCQDKDDVPCARRLWQGLQERDLDYLPAVSGLAWTNSRQKNFGEAMRILNRGLKISPDYIPLLTLLQQAEQEGWNVAR
jgi:tetratricopeptide (TPR) repeat protein